MLRYLPPHLISHPCLTQKQRTALAAIPEKELTKYETEAVGQLVELLIREQVPLWSNYFPVSTDGLCAGRALVTNLLRTDYLFTPDEIEAGRLDAETAGPARLLALFFHASTTKRNRLLARLQAVADTASKSTNARVAFASQLAA